MIHSDDFYPVKPDALAINNALIDRDFYRNRAKQRAEAARILDQVGAHSTAFDLRKLAEDDERIANRCEAYARECGYTGE